MSTEATGNGGQIARATVIDVPMSGQRSLATVTAEIRAYQDAARRMAITYCIEVGRRLVEAKDMVSHGEWGSYLKRELGFSQSRANDLMRIFEAYAADQMRLDGDNLKNQAFGNLSYTQALALLALPSEEDRLEFVEEHDMAKLSTRQLQEELRRRMGADGGEQGSPLRGTGADPSTGLEAGPPPLQAGEVSEGALLSEMFDDGARGKAAAAQEDETALLRDRLKAAEDEARTVGERWEAAMDEIRSQNLRQEKLEEQAKQAASQLAAAQALAEARAEDLKKAKEAMQKALDAKKKAKDELKAARADKSVPAETLEKLRREAEEAARKALEAEGGGKSVQEAAAKLAEAEQAAAEARQRADEMASNARRYAEEKEALERQLRLAAPEMAVFKASFERVQKELLALVERVDELPADKQAGGWKAMAALAGQISRIVEAHTEGVRA